ncbi:MAG: hypothetical protein GX910_00315 [Clostridiaceae bacterium]|jgi:hypothetical protein|nr:hypothetical protein [Clostridiaceae bacterium]
MHKIGHKQSSYAATDYDAVRCYFRDLSSFQDWTLGECIVAEREGLLAIYRAEDRDGLPFLLYVTPIRAWSKEERILQHIKWVNDALAHGSFRYNACEPMIQQLSWKRSGMFFFGITPDRGLRPVIEAAPFSNRSSLILNMVYVTALLRFLECDVWPFTCNGLNREKLLDKAAALSDRVAPRLHNASEISKRWESFYQRNAENVARTHDFTPVFSIGDYLSKCLVYCSECETFYLEGAFSFSPGTRSDDLCSLLFLFRKQSSQNKQYLVDFYFDMDVPNQFFTYLSHRHMTSLLEQIDDSEKGSREDQIARHELRLFSETREGFRTPVPVWYKPLE